MSKIMNSRLGLIEQNTKSREKMHIQTDPICKKKFPAYLKNFFKVMKPPTKIFLRMAQH